MDVHGTYLNSQWNSLESNGLGVRRDAALGKDGNGMRELRSSTNVKSAKYLEALAEGLGFIQGFYSFVEGMRA